MRRRVLIIAPIVHHAVANPRAIRSARVVAGLAERGWRVSVASFWFGPGDPPALSGASEQLAFAAGDPFAAWRDDEDPGPRAEGPDPDGLAEWGRELADRAGSLESSPDVIYAIAYPVGALVAGAAVSERLGAPLVADLGDPWRAQSPAERELRDEVLGRCGALVTTTEALAGELRERLPAGAPVDLIPGGGELRHRPEAAGPPLFVHLGAVHAGRAPARGAFAALCERERRGKLELRSHTASWDIPGEPPLEHDPLPMLPHDKALDLTARAGAALVLGNRTREQVPSKAYEISCTETWALCVSALEDDPTVAVLAEGGHAVVAAGPSREAVGGAIDRILELEDAGERPEPVRRHTWSARIDRISGLLGEVAARPRS